MKKMNIKNILTLFIFISFYTFQAQELLTKETAVSIALENNYGIRIAENSVKIAENDVNYKVKHAREFLEEGNHVKFRVFLKGREMANPQAGVDVLNKVWPMIEDLAVMDKEPKLEGRYVNMMALPKKD